MFTARVTLTGTAQVVLAKLQGIADNQKDFYLLLGRRGVNVLRDWFRRADATRANKRGWPRSHFWLDVMRSVSQSPRVTEGGVIISINHPVIAHKVGVGPAQGHIVPRVAKWLTIPNVPEAYGKSAKEYEQGGGEGRKLVFIKKGEQLAFLAEINIEPSGETNKNGKPKAAIRQLKIIYILKKHVYQPPMPDALPDTATWQDAIGDEWGRFIDDQLANPDTREQDIS
jgi:hypothetical protein